MGIYLYNNFIYKGGLVVLSENLRNLRKAKGLSQEELAAKINVVRQTISKWEKGLSVPDSEMLIKIADELDTSVSILLGETITSDEDDNTELKAITAKLELLNEQFAKRNENRRKMWRIIFIIIGVIALSSLLFELVSFIHYQYIIHSMNENISIIGGADSPTSIYVSNISIKAASVITTVIASAASIVGIYITKKK